MMKTNILDCNGLACPMPIVKINEFVKLLEPNETLEIAADDPSFESDIIVWCKRMGYELVELKKDSGFKVTIRKL